MKQWMIVTLASVGGYAILQWWRTNKPTGAGASVTQSLAANIRQNQTGDAAGRSSTGWLTSGVPVFDDTAVANGHGDLVVAAQHTNDLATSPGGSQYTPAFGPDENRGGLSIM